MTEEIIEKSQICTIICSFNPNYQKLRDLSSILSCFSEIFIVDNSQSINDDRFNDIKGLTIIKTEKNLGTLKAYNKVIERYSDFEYYWLWNQDTILSKKSAEKFLRISKQLFIKNNELVATTFFDKKNKINPFNKNQILVKESSSLFNKKQVYRYTNSWFDENLFMDYGDWDLSLRIESKGGEIAQISDIEYIHYFGEPENTVLGKMYRSSEKRLYMQGLNSAYLFRKRRKTSFLVLLLICRVFILPLKNLFFKNSFQRSKSYFKGIIDGLHGKTSSEYMNKY